MSSVLHRPASEKGVSRSFAFHHGQRANLPGALTGRASASSGRPDSSKYTVTTTVTKTTSRQRRRRATDEAGADSLEANTVNTAEPRTLQQDGQEGDQQRDAICPGPSDGSSGKSSGTTRTLSTTASGFADQAYKNGILDPLDSKPPPNIEDVRERLARSRATASPPETEYKRYIHKVEGAPNNATLVYEVGGKLLKEYDDEGYSRAFNQAFTGYPENVGFNNGLSAPQPDFVEGLRKREYRPFPVDERVSGAVLYKDDPHSLKLPHLAGEWKGPGKNMKEARMQAAYDGAALVYARNQALDTMGEPYLADDAKVTTFTTDGTNLSLFAHHAAPTEEGVLEYYQYPIKSINLIDSHQGYKEGRKHLRNAQDYAKEQSYALKDQLKEHYKQQRSASSTLHPVAAEVPPLPVLDVEPLATTQTYEDGDGGDYGVVGPQPVYSYQPTPPASSKPKHNKSHHSHHSHHSHSAPHSSGGLSPTHSSARNSGGKRKASSSQSFHELSEHISKHGSYWKKDAVSGQYYCKHSDGTVSWRDDEEDEHDCS